MPNYKMYMIGAAGAVERVAQYDAPDDVAAIRVAFVGMDRQRRELWCGSRLVDSWTSDEARHVLAKARRCLSRQVRGSPSLS